MALDDTLPAMFREDLHRYQMQNTSATGTLTQALTQLSLESNGASPEAASWGSYLLSAMGGLLFGKTGAKVTSIEFVPKKTRNSAGQIEVNMTSSDAIKMLESNGYKKNLYQDGTITVMTNGDKIYRFYPRSTSTGQPTASLNIEGIKNPVTKIRFIGE
ncbi:MULTISPECIES: hypothetical protein [Pseudomonas]|uniref:Uncharacterized protein n=1 Tax=Pseudomonas fluorescens TaxID=294 RepID=A0A0N9WT82_PSEFL|nr:MULTISPECIES: hypothetical protein [Pseudomonas]ALI06014.1 hypothetical protein AO356_04175 [Pseudomonas fluorescens]